MIPAGAHVIDMRTRWEDEAKKLGLAMITCEWNQDDAGWQVVVARLRDSSVHAGVVPYAPGGPLSLRFQFAAVFHSIAHEDNPDPPEMVFFGRNMLAF